MSRLVLALVAAALLSPTAVHARPHRTEFATWAVATCTPLPTCAVAQRGTITCPGGGEPSSSPMPPWCGPGSRTRVRDRVLILSVVQANDPRVTGTISLHVNMNLDSDTFSGPVWGKYTMEVPDLGTWEGIWVGRVQSATYWTYQVVLHGTEGLDGLFLLAEGRWRAGDGDRLTGQIVDARRHQ